MRSVPCRSCVAIYSLPEHEGSLDGADRKVVVWRWIAARKPALLLATRRNSGDSIMAWTRPILREICIGMEINGYLAGKL
jgi:coenzyme PQQ precursor peptide PqqA